MGVVGVVVLVPVARGLLPDVLVGLDLLRDRRFAFFLSFIAGIDVGHVRSVPASADFPAAGFVCPKMMWIIADRPKKGLAKA